MMRRRRGTHSSLWYAMAGYIEETPQSKGYVVSSQAYTVQGTSVRNLEVVLGGTSLAEEIVLIGAHYDTVSGSPEWWRALREQDRG